LRFVLRSYVDADWPALLALWIDSWTKTRPDIDFVARGPWLQALFVDSLSKGAHIVVAEDKKGLLGFVLYEPARRWLEQIAVAPRGFGSGAAQALIARAKQSCPEGFSLDVNADNRRALAFYHLEGFSRTTEGRNPLSGLPTVTLRWAPESAR
jgi:putative acetyltransferase